jgi:pimeloyl-ACP methyl ester carboxylesterase
MKISSARNSNHAFPETRHIGVNGISLAYHDWPGEHGPLICLPNITGHKGSFSSLAARLSPQYRVLAVDMRGRCDSDKPPEGYGFAYHTKDILGFADALGIKQFSLIGHSFGATTGVYIASIHPDRVRSLVLIDGGADPKVEILRTMYQTIRRLEKTYASLDEYVAIQRSVPFHRPWTPMLDRYVRDDVEIMPNGSVRSKSSSSALTKDLDLHFSYSMCLHFPNVQCPVLFLRPLEGLQGESGHVYSESETANIVRSIPLSRRENVNGGNHYTVLLQDDPPVAPYIEEFLEQVYKEPAPKKLS